MRIMDGRGVMFRHKRGVSSYRVAIPHKYSHLKHAPDSRPKLPTKTVYVTDRKTQRFKLVAPKKVEWINTMDHAAMRIYIMKVRRQNLALCVDGSLSKNKLVTRCRAKGTDTVCSPVLYWSIK